MGFGLVVGLRNTGDSQQTGFTKQALTNLLSHMGIAPQESEFKSRNVAAVMVTTNLPAFVKIGDKLDVTVSSLGDATSLQGGTLLMTPLSGPDEDVYAVAQGTISVGGLYDFGNAPPIARQPTTVGRVPGGALVEKEVGVSMGQGNILSIVLNQPDFTTAYRVAYTIAKKGMEARAVDAGTIAVSISENEDLVPLVAKIENLKVVPDVVARVVINERTGTVVIGENVRLAPVAVTYGNINVSIQNVDYTQYNYGKEDQQWMSTETNLKVKDQTKLLVGVEEGANLKDLIKALNAIGASSRDLIAILQAIKKAGALTGELEII
jgi:flagellar P-ring protein precursor FlgI